MADGRNQLSWPAKDRLKLFITATSSASSDLNLSMMGIIHSMPWSSLTLQTIEKLFFINSNITAVYEDPVPDPYDRGCSRGETEDGSNTDQEEIAVQSKQLQCNYLSTIMKPDFNRQNSGFIDRIQKLDLSGRKFGF